MDEHSGAVRFWEICTGGTGQTEGDGGRWGVWCVTCAPMAWCSHLFLGGVSFGPVLVHMPISNSVPVQQLSEVTGTTKDGKSPFDKKPCEEGPVVGVGWLLSYLKLLSSVPSIVCAALNQ